MAGNEDIDKDYGELDLVKFLEGCINSKKNDSIFKVKEPGVKDFYSIRNTPRLVITLTKDGRAVCQAFLFVDKVLVYELESPSAVYLLQLWISAHYVFNIG